ncbi:MAG TPA: MBL fold metallo-hydrolase [Gammaproteobacteria bacterium]|nr:MBL fold metallo-hydrolase [Gammaproteobacteria bacterium]HCY05067.1 MBL fold metallo-hydrolase [Gammaproteobacteria bacterium]|tara:strand:- start:1207 stop:2109 length:903 start_codon:yes stop_codon:yes gene_type:complete
MAVEIPYRRELDFEYGQVDTLAPGIRRVIANNPGPFTFSGTGTYILGTGKVAVIDPGPDDQEHIDAILAALEGESISHILVTHTHMDHSPGCKKLQAACDAPTYAYGRHGAGKIEQGINVEEGGDMDFDPDHLVRHGDIIEGGDWSVECVYTPGHTSNHMCFALREQKALFSGDHVMGWSTSIVSPPDGDMSEYMDSLELLLDRDDVIYWPTHGPCIEEPKAHVRAFIQHRQEREQQIIDCLEQGIFNIREMVPAMYHDTPEFMYPAAARSVLAAMDNLLKKQRVVLASGAGLEGEYRLA